MKLPQVPPSPAENALKARARQGSDDPRITPEMRKAAEGLESVFTGEMLKAMRGTVEESEFSLKNSATEIYQSMLDHEYADIAAKQNSLGLSRQILDYWLRSMPQEQYNNERNTQARKPIPTGQEPAKNVGRTGGTHEGQSE